MAGAASTPKARLFLVKNMVSRPGGTSIPEICEELEVSRWTAMRLLRDTELSGTPVEKTWEDSGTRFVVPSGARGAQVTLTQFEMIGVAVAQQTARYLDGTPLAESMESVFTKIAAALKRPDLVSNLRRKIYDANEGAMRFTKRDAANIQALIDALLRDEQVAVKHERVEKGTLEFRVDPYTLLFHKKGPYLVGKSHHAGHKNETRTFAFDGIRSLRWCKGEPFEYPPTYTPERQLRGAFGIVRGESVAIRVRFRKEVLRAVKRRAWHRSQRVGEVEGDWFEVTFECAASFEVQNWILGWGRNAEVITPAALRESVAREATAMVAVYAGRAAGE
jgi:predicted DNA-binding transcriptional regulator YafY